MNITTPLPSLENPPHHGRRAILIAMAIFALLSTAASLTSEGFLEADGCTHYLYARFALSERHFLVNVWGRPVCTCIYAIPAVIGGLNGVRAMSMLLALATAAITWRIAIHQNFRWPALAGIFVLAQPMVFLHSFSELTEMPFTVLLAGAFWAYVARQWWLFALLAGTLPASRPEGFGFSLLAAFALICHRKPLHLAILILPLLIWNHFGWLLFGATGPWWRWLPDNWPYSSESVYKPGALMHFVLFLPAIVSPLVFPAILVGMWRCLVGRDGNPAETSPSGDTAGLPSRPTQDEAIPNVPGYETIRPGNATLAELERRFFRDHLFRCNVLIVGIPLLILVGHSLLYRLGKMASSGELRYMMIVAPFWALLACRGWAWLCGSFTWSRSLALAVAAVAFPVLVNFTWTVVPLRATKEWQDAEAVGRWYRDWPERSTLPSLAAAHPAVFFALDRSPTARDSVVEWQRDKLAALPRGTLLMWDPIYSLYNADKARSIKIEDLLAMGWKDITPKVEKAPAGWHILRSDTLRSAAQGEK